MIKLYKQAVVDGKTVVKHVNAEKDQIKLMEAAGWTRNPDGVVPASKEPKEDPDLDLDPEDLDE